MGLICRPEQDRDAAFLLGLFVATNGGQLSSLDPALRGALLRHQFAGQDATYRALYPAGRFAIVEHGGEPIGRAITDLSTDALLIVDIAVLPAWQGNGMGTSILREFQREAQVAGVPLRLSVPLNNVDARRLYERLGFSSTGEDGTHTQMRWTP